MKPTTSSPRSTSLHVAHSSSLDRSDRQSLVDMGGRTRQSRRRQGRGAPVPPGFEDRRRPAPGTERDDCGADRAVVNAGVRGHGRPVLLAGRRAHRRRGGCGFAYVERFFRRRRRRRRCRFGRLGLGSRPWLEAESGGRCRIAHGKASVGGCPGAPWLRTRILTYTALGTQRQMTDTLLGEALQNVGQTQPSAA